MKEVERRTALACLAAVEANLAELRDLPGWWLRISSERRADWYRLEAQCRTDQHELRHLVLVQPESG